MISSIQQLKLSYYQALNATLKGDQHRANDFHKLISEDESLLYRSKG